MSETVQVQVIADIAFEEFPKIARLAREMVVTEKIDGTNAQVIVSADGRVLAGSRSRLITPESDNFGFARWVQDHADELAAGLGEGRHFGEWWGAGIQRRYGLSEKRFSLFNVARWTSDPARVTEKRRLVLACCHVVPVLVEGEMFDTARVSGALTQLAATGSVAAPGFMKPEGVVIYHTASGALYKRTIEKDGAPKSRTDGAT